MSKSSVKSKKCRVCKTPFKPFLTTQIVCGTACALKYAQIKREKAYKAETNRLKREYYDNDKQHWKKKATEACHAYIRERDAQRGCVSCGSTTAGQYHAGHYRTRKAATHLAFCEHNIHRQCAQCNNFESGNIGNYRIELIRRIGLEMVEYLENNNATYKYTLEDFKDIHEYYTQKKADLLEAGQVPR